MNTETESRQRKFLRFLMPAAVIIFIVLAVQLIYCRRQSDFTELQPVNGVLNIENIDFSDEVFTLANDWDFYPGRLYGPEDFAAGTEPPREISPDSIPCGTHRLIIEGKPDSCYAICGYSVDYSSRILVDGTEEAAFGKVAETEEDFEPGTGYYSVPVLTDENGRAEIIFQYANYVHNEGGTVHATYLSTPQNIEEYKRGDSLVSVFIGGALMVLALFFLLFSVVLDQINYLLLGFCCMVFALRDQLFAFIYLFSPELDWDTGYRIHIAVVNLLPVSLLLLLGNIYPAIRKWVRNLYIGMSSVFLMLVFMLDTHMLRCLNEVAYICGLPYLIYIIISIAVYFREIKHLRTEDVVLLTGFGVLVVSVLLEGILSGHSAGVVRYGLSPSAMLIFIFMMDFALSLRARERERELAESRSRSLMLENMNAMNMDFLHKVAHELRTPLTVISGYAQLTGMQMSMGQFSDDSRENMKTIQNEAQRLAELVNTLMDYSYGKESEAVFVDLPVKPLLERVRAICTPMCIKNNNKVETEEKNCGDIWGSGEMLLQIFINLVVNANRHTKNGSITVSASDSEEEGMVVFRVSDTGSGIPVELLEHIFEKGCSGDGGSGLGLSICRDAVESHGGTIEVEKTGEDGTVFRFTVLRKEHKL